MRERPILFSGPMVRAILDGRKTQTRRVVKRVPDHNLDGPWVIANSPYGKPGDRLWVRESFYVDHIDYAEHQRLGSERPDEVTDEMLYYPADARQGRPHWCCQLIPECYCAEVGKAKARSGRFMPRWASRIALEITGICVERLQDIADWDAWSEGVDPVMATDYTNPDNKIVLASCRENFSNLWDGINGKDKYVKGAGFGGETLRVESTSTWASNPWVWVVKFRHVESSAPKSTMTETP